MSSTDFAGINWGADRVLPAFQTPQHVTVFDMRGASNETQLSVATMAGLVNRPVPRVYIIWNDEDAFWLKQLLGTVSQENSPANGDGALDGMLITFRDAVQGMIVYDPNFPDSVNIATTMAGQYDCVVVSPDQADSLQQPFNLPVHTDLRNQHWSNRSAAYDWARQNLLSGASAHAVAGLDPAIAGLRSFLVANRIFTYWLDSRSGEQGLMAQIYKAFAPGAVHLGWFVDEPSGVKLTSNAALPVLATDLSTNLEVWTGVPNATSIAQSNPAEPIGSIDASKVYLSFTISDGDNLQYIQRRMMHLWQDAARGSFPLGWTISPVLSQAAPAIAAYYAHSATPHDELIAGPSGAGYMFPSQWPQQQLATFLQQTAQMMRSMNLTTLEVLDMPDDTGGTSILDLLKQAISSLLGLSSAGSLLEILPLLESEIPGLRGSQLFSSAALQTQYAQALAAPAGVNGILSGAGVKVPGLVQSAGGIPVYYNLGLADSIQSTINLVKSASLLLKQRPLFLNVYLLAWKMGPSDIKQVIQQLGGGYVVVKPGTLLRMIKQVHAKVS